jgi:sulfatase modifying factor 1
MKRLPFITLAATAVLISSASASTTTMEWVTVGNPGNAADTTGYGAVSYAYNIGKYEVTNAQYGEFLNAKGQSNSNGIYNANMASFGITQSGTSGSFTYNLTGALANKPVVYVSWYDAARFANWLLNGKGSGNMEDGAYTLSGNLGTPGVNPGVQIYLPSEDEWYKAAYYQGSGTYSLYPNGLNTISTDDANYGNLVGASTDVGSYAAPSFLGTYDQGGNVWEWNNLVFGGSRGYRGGAWNYNMETLRATDRYYFDPTLENDHVGFRVASSIAAVPEPTSLLALAGLLGGGLSLRRRSKNSL